MLLTILGSLLCLTKWVEAINTAISSPCIPDRSSTDDDVPAINSALKKCGDGGTIRIPSSSVYQIASQVDFSECYGCTFQVDGTLNISADWTKWTTTNTIFQLHSANNVSILGNGLIDGNGLNMYGKWGTVKYNFTAAPTTFNITNASGISVVGLCIINPFLAVFHIHNSSSLDFSSLTIKTDADTYSRVSFNSVGAFDIAQSSDVYISNIAIHEVYTCILVHSDSKYIHVAEATCASSDRGFVVDTQYDYGPINTVHDVSFSHLNISRSMWATGFIAFYGTVRAAHITWDDVEVNGVDTAVLITPCMGGTSACGSGRGVTYDFEGISFNDFRGIAREDKLVRCVEANTAACEAVGFTDFAIVTNKTMDKR